MRIWLFVIQVIWASGMLLQVAQAQKTLPHVKAEAREGDGVFTLLDRYQVKTPCNIAYFYRINGLRKKQGLQEGRQYFLPIYVYAYNGKSIRSTTGVNDRPWAEKIQAYNEYLTEAGLKQTDYREEDQLLWVPYHQLYCREEDQPLPTQVSNAAVESTADVVLGSTSSIANKTPQVAGGDVPLRGTYKIFGEKYARVPLESTALSGRVYYVVSGHGGPDPGAVGQYGRKSLCEDEYAYDVSLRLARNLLAHGATVYLITRDDDDGIREGEILPCDKDEECWLDQKIPINQSQRLTQRSDAINQLYKKNKKQGVQYQRLIVIHIDSNSRGNKMDMYFYHKIGDDQSLDFASDIHQTIKRKYAEYRKGRGYSGTVSSRDLHMLRETEPTAVFIELGNIRNRNDQARFVIEGNRQLVANWLFEGMLSDLKGR